MTKLRFLISLFFLVLLVPFLGFSQPNEEPETLQPLQTTSSQATFIKTMSEIPASFVNDGITNTKNAEFSVNVEFFITSFFYILAYFFLIVLFFLLNHKNKVVKQKPILTPSTERFKIYWAVEYLISNNRLFILILEFVKGILVVIFFLIISIMSPFQLLFYLTYFIVVLFTIIDKFIKKMKVRISSIEQELTPLRDHLQKLEID